MEEQTFTGCKVALFIGDQILTILRDDDPEIAFPNMWDLPGGGREGNELREETLAREVMEEVGLVIPAQAFLWKRRFRASFRGDGYIWFYIARMPAGTEHNIVFGDEGQRWELMDLAVFMELDEVVDVFAPRLQKWIDETGGLE